MLYANTFWWLAFLGVEEDINWKLYISKAQNVLLLNHEYKMLNTQPGKIAKGLYSDEYILQVISGLAEAFAKLAFIEYNQNNYNQENIKTYLKQGEFLLIQHAPISILPQRREYYNFYFSYACFYSMKAELMSELNEETEKYLGLCLKGLQEAAYSESKINTKQFVHDLEDALKKELKFFQQKRNDTLEYIKELSNAQN